jgi:Zn-dependent metalloprotease
MFVSSKVLAATAAALAMAVSASAQGRPTFELPAARTSQRSGGTLTPPSNASPAAVLAQYLRDQGRDEATVRSIAEVSRGSSRNGIAQGRYEQRVGGLPVYGTYAKAAFNSRGELVSVIENFVSVPAVVASARVSAQQAIEAAVKNLYPDLTSRAGFFRNPPSATRVAIPQTDGSMSVGYLVET